MGIAQRKENTEARLKEYLRRQLEVRGVKKIATDRVTVRVQANSAPSVRAESPTVIEELYAAGSPLARQRVEYSLDYDAIVRLAKEEGDIPAGIIISKGSHLRVT